MNEVDFQYKYLIMCYYGGIEDIRILWVNKEINRTILGGINYLQPAESLQELLLGRGNRDTRQGHHESVKSVK